MPAKRRQPSRANQRRPRANREQQTRYFIGTEGLAERALARWIESLCKDTGYKIWFDIRENGPGGGSTLAIVQRTLTNRNHSHRGPYAHTLVFLDEDRRAVDGPAAEELAHREGIHLVWQTPNIEGLLLRLFPRQEQTRPPANQTLRALQYHWPNYQKSSMARADLQELFTLSDLQRTARFDPSLSQLLSILSLDNA